MSLVNALVGDFVYLLDFVDKFSYFGMVEVVAVFVCKILAFMTQKHLVENSDHHQTINNLCNKVFAVYFYFVGKMGNFHCDLVEGVNCFENSLNWLLYLGDSHS